MTIGIAGGGAFGTALGVALARDGQNVQLWARDAAAVAQMQSGRENARLPGVTLPDEITISTALDPLFVSDTLLLAIPAQALVPFLQDHSARLAGKVLVACCKGIDLQRMTGPASTIRDLVPDAQAAILTGPSFAADIARGLPTALTIACADDATGIALQQMLSTPTLRLYRTTDIIGAELGGALKNVMAIAAGVTIGAGLGDSARAALITRGFAEMQRLVAQLGGQADTLGGLSGLGDLVLTCTSEQSRNYRFGVALGAGQAFDTTATVEGAATACALRQLALDLDIDLPICTVVADLTMGRTNVKTALHALLSRPLKEEQMRFALLAKDKPGALQTRLDNRDAHLAYVAETGVVEIAGPLLDAEGQMCGSLIILDVADLGTAQAWAAADPYAKAGLFGDVTLSAWKKVIG